jgi:predicted DNA-binding transcriptional regulator AlpA
MATTRNKVLCPDAVPAHTAYSVREFCCLHGIGRSTFYALLAAGLGPRTFKVGARTLISAEAAEEWRRTREGRAA